MLRRMILVAAVAIVAGTAAVAMPAGQTVSVPHLQLARATTAATYGATTLPVAPTGSTYPVPSSIAADCSSEVTAPLNTFLASVPDNSTVTFPSGACYHIEGVLVVDRKHTVAIVGNGAQLVTRTDGSGIAPQVVRDSGGIAANWPASRKQLLVVKSTDITISGLVMHGPNTAGTWNATFANQNAIQINGTTGLLIDHVAADHVYGDAVDVGGNSAQVTIQNSSAVSTGRMCVAVGWGSYVTYQNNTTNGCTGGNFDIEPLNTPGNQWSAQHILITHNDVTGGLFVLSNVGGMNAVTGDIELSYNTLHAIKLSVIVGGGGQGPCCVIRNNYRIIGNTSDVIAGLDAHGIINLNSVNGALIQGNTEPFLSPLPKNTWTQAVVISNSRNVTVSGNAFTNVSQLLAPGNSWVGQSSTAMSASVQPGATTITILGRLPAEMIWRIGSGTSAELVNSPHGCFTSPCTLTLGQPLLNAHPAGEPIVSAPNDGKK